MSTERYNKEDLLLRTLEDFDTIDDINAVNRVRRESENEIESTTDSSDEIMHTTSQEIESNTNQVSTTFSTTLQLPHPDSSQQFLIDNKFSDHYKHSETPHAQYVSITTIPPVLKNYYDFNPSQPDYFYHHSYNYVPMCYLTSLSQPQFRSQFIPIAYNYGNKYPKVY